MQRPSDFRKGHQGLLSSHRYGAGKWEDYILDTQAHIYDGAQAQVKAVESLGRQVAEQQGRQAELLQDFIAQSGDAWDRVSDQLDSMTDHLATGFSTLSHQIAYNGVLLGQIVDQLGIIAQALHNPLATQGNERVNSGRHLMERGLYKEAFDDFTEAEKLRPVNPLLHVFIAQLHYQVREEGVPYDLSAAERHVNLAIRYATSLRADLGEKADAVIDLVYRTAAHVALVKGSDLSLTMGTEAGINELRRGHKFLCQISRPSPSSRFLNAQTLALMGRPEDSIGILRLLADFTRSWIPRALAEPNLAAVADRVRGLSEELKMNPGTRSQVVYPVIAASRDFTVHCTSVAKEFSTPALELSDQINGIEHDFEAGAVNAVSAADALEAALDSAKGRTLGLIRASIDALHANQEQELGNARVHASKATNTWKLTGLLGASIDAIFDTIKFEDNQGTIVIGYILGWILGAMSCKSVVQGWSNQLIYFVFSGPIIAILILMLKNIAEYGSNKISRSDAAAEESRAMGAREQADKLQKRIDDLERMCDALKRTPLPK